MARKLERDTLRKLGVPKVLAEQFMAIDALELPGPSPTEELVRATLLRCEATLRDLPVRPRAAAPPTLGPCVVPAPALGRFVEAFTETMFERAMPFAHAHRHHPAVLLVDNHSVIEPTRWANDPGLLAIDSACRGVSTALERVSGRPVRRVIVVNEHLDAYQPEDLRIIRNAITHPMTRDTYLVAARRAGRFQYCGAAVLANEVVFELERGDAAGTISMPAPGGTFDASLANTLYGEVIDLEKAALRVYDGERLNPKLRVALAKDSDQALLDVLEGLM